jgi:hypothetical protein
MHIHDADFAIGNDFRGFRVSVWYNSDIVEIITEMLILRDRKII